MKKIVSIICCLSLLVFNGATFASASNNNMGEQVVDKNYCYDSSSTLPTEISLKIHEVAKIKIKCNETTGYSWEIVPDNSGVYEITKNEYIPDRPIIPGSGGNRVFTIKGVREGKGSVMLQLYAPGKKTPVETHCITIKIMP